MLLLYLLALVGVPASTAAGAKYEEVSWYTKSILRGEVGVLGQGVRIPSKLFAHSSCQLVYLATPDWSTSQVYVDFGSASPATGCKRQAFLVYVDGFNTPRAATGIGSSFDVPWATLVTAPATVLTATYNPSPSPGTSTSNSGSQSSSPPPALTTSKEGTVTVSMADTAGRRWWNSKIDIPLDRLKFSSKYDNLQDIGAGLPEELFPEPGGPLSRPVLASAYLQASSNTPQDPRAYLYTVEKEQQQKQQRQQQRQQSSNGAENDGSSSNTRSNDGGSSSSDSNDGGSSSSDSSSSESGSRFVGLVSGRLRIYSPFAPLECLDVLYSWQGKAVVVDGGSSSGSSSSGNSTSGSFWNPLASDTQNSCFVTQQAVLLYNDCPSIAASAPSTESDGGGSSTNSDGSSNATSSSNSLPYFNCSNENGMEAEIACLMDQQLLELAANMSYVPSDADVRVMVYYKPYNDCYRQSAQRVGQTGYQLIFFTAGLIVLLTLILLLPTAFRLFISFPIRCIVYGIRKLFQRSRVNDLPLDTGLHSYKEPVHHRFFELPVVRHLLGARKYLMYAMCTIHSADGQYRALQVCVTSSVALMICMMSFPPNLAPSLDFYIPPLNFRIERDSGDPLSNVIYFVTILAYSLYLGFIGYLAMLTNYNRPRNKYYLTQCILSVIFMLVLDAMVLIQVYSILLYWDHLSPQWPWLPITTFQLGNLAVANVTLVATLISREDRNVVLRRTEYHALMEELRSREAHLAAVKAMAAAAARAAGGAAAGGATNTDADANTAFGGGKDISPATVHSRAGLPPLAAAAELPPSTVQQTRHRRRHGGSAVGSQPSSLPENGRSTEMAATGGSGNWGSHSSVHINPLAAMSLPPRAGSTVGSAGGSSGAVADTAAVAEKSSPSGGRVKSVMSLRFASLTLTRQRWRERQAGGRLGALLRRWLRPISEDAAFRYPAWLLAALLVSSYMLVFVYARAMSWAHVVGDCLANPADCLNDNLARYVVFATRLLGHKWQVRLRDTLNLLTASQSSLQGLVEGVITGDRTVPGFNATVDTLASNLTAVVAAAATSHVSSLLANPDVVGGLLNDTLGPDIAAALPANRTAALQARLVEVLAARLTDVNLTATSDTVVRSVQTGLLQGLNVSMTQVTSAVTAISSVVKVAVDVPAQLDSWKHDLEKRFFWCSLAGFTLGLLLGLSSLVRTAISFRTSARKLRLARIAARVLASSYDTDDGTGGAGKWAMSNFKNVYDEEDSIVRRSEATGISWVVFFFGVLLSTAVVQLYAVGVTLSVGFALVSLPWTWTWLLPRYYLWLVAVIAGLFLNKVVLINFIGNTWLSDGDRIYRPAAWLAFLVIASATNLVIGLLLALYRIILLLLTTIFALGKLDVTLFTMLAKLDLPHTTFLAGLHLQESMSNFHDPIYLPGPRGRAHRRWRKLRVAVAKCGGEKLRQLVSEPSYPDDGVVKEVQVGSPYPHDADQVLVVVPAEPPLEEGEVEEGEMRRNCGKGGGEGDRRRDSQLP